VALLRGKVSQIVQNVSNLSNLQIFVAALQREGLGGRHFVHNGTLLGYSLSTKQFYEVIVDEAEDRINYHLVEIESK